MLRRPVPSAFNWPRPRPPGTWPGTLAARRSSSQSQSQASRIDRITSRLPRRLQRYTNGLRSAPVSHVVSFFILHEITAIVPLFALFALFHYTAYVPVSYMTDHFGEHIRSGITRFERYFRRKGWFGFSPQDEPPVSRHETAESRAKSHAEDVMQRCRDGDRKYEILVEFALAYAVTKALLPLRIIGSVWATPWFASVLMRIKTNLTRKP
ncbi:hypothetical protein CDD83_10907 [Cordyceps sp. RAO-2017]|nr:hypothetical protein CDD83_10907 [Cordyceps sp. RAO-2017]